MNAFEQMGIGNAPRQPSNVGTTSLLAGITSGRSTAGQRIVIGAQEKVGKTSLACDAPRALLIPLEQGYAAQSIPRVPMIDTFDQTMQLLREIKSACMRGDFRPRTLAFDSGTALERQIHDSVLRRDKKYQPGNAGGLTMEAALEGYGKAYQYANELFADFLALCDELAFNAGINIVITVHIFAARQMDPAHGEFDQWDILLHSPKNNKNYGKREMITQWADMIGILHEPFFITKGDDKSNFAQGTTLNRGRVLAVDRTPQFVAGNRYGIGGVVPIPDPTKNPYGTAWNSLAHAIYNASGVDVFNRDVG
jgi:hypothetical protein